MNTNLSLHPSVFISSTFIDFKNERKAVADVLKEESINVNALDIQPASNNSSKDQIIRGIKESDFVILLVGNRYGSILPDMTNSRKSITHWEYVISRCSRKNVLVFFSNYSNKDDPKFYDVNDNEFKEKQIKLENFKQELSRSHNPSYFDSIEDLKIKVKSAIIPAYRGIISDLMKNKATSNQKISELEAEIRKIKSTINTPLSPIGIIDRFKY